MLPALVPPLVSTIKSYVPLVVISPSADPEPRTISPVPLGAKVMLPFAPSNNVMFPALVPVFVF